MLSLTKKLTSLLAASLLGLAGTAALAQGIAPIPGSHPFVCTVPTTAPNDGLAYFTSVNGQQYLILNTTGFGNSNVGATTANLKGQIFTGTQANFYTSSLNSCNPDLDNGPWVFVEGLIGHDIVVGFGNVCFDGEVVGYANDGSVILYFSPEDLGLPDDVNLQASFIELFADDVDGDSLTWRISRWYLNRHLVGGAGTRVLDFCPYVPNNPPE